MNSIRILTFLIIIGAAGLIYAVTLCPTVEFVDSGELALACKNLGIAHPTGYPLYTLLGRLAAMILGGELITRMNQMSLFFTAIAAGFLSLVMMEMLTMENKRAALTAGTVSLFTALSPVWWSQGTTNEVYSLNLLLISLFVYSILKYLRKTSSPGWLILSAYILGLAFTNHLSAVYLVPGYALIAGSLVWRRKIRMIAFMWMIAMISIPLTLYVFLPVRAAFSPFLNWGDVSDSYFLYKHITGWQYRIWMFSDADIGVVLGRLVYSGELMVDQFGWFGIVSAAAGLFPIFKRHRNFGIFLTTIGLLNLAYAANYQIADIDSYYLPMILVISLFMASGVSLMAGHILKLAVGSRFIKLAVAGGLMLLPVSNLINNYHESDRNNRTFARQGAVDMVDSMLPDGLAIIENWDFYSPWLYLSFEEKYRPDAILLDKELMRRSWYIDFIRRQYPEIYGRSESPIRQFLERVESFERNRPFDPLLIDSAYYGMLRAIIENESLSRPVYTNVTADPKFLRMFRLVPDGILFRIHDANEYLERPLFSFDESGWSGELAYREQRVGQILNYYNKAFAGRESYCRYFGRADEAKHYKILAERTASIMRELRKSDGN